MTLLRSLSRLRSRAKSNEHVPVSRAWDGRSDELSVVSSEAELRDIVQEPTGAVADKAISHVDEQSRRFINASPFFLLATTSDDGSVDVSPRGDQPGNVLVSEDRRSLALPDRKGNRRLDSLRNILRHPQVGLLFIVPGVNETIRVNGRATIVRAGPFFDALSVRGTPPDLAVVIEVQELFLHCAKAFLRSKFWDFEAWPDRDSIPSAGRIAKSQSGVPVPAAVLDAALHTEARVNQ